MSDDKKTHYELCVGAIAILQTILPSPNWYKGDPRAGSLICRADEACEAMPELPQRPEGDEKNPSPAFKQRIEEWAAPIMEFEWNDKQKAAVTKCVKHYIDQGSLASTKNTVALLKLCGLDD
jgi:hypothetical protein